MAGLISSVMSSISTMLPLVIALQISLKKFLCSKVLSLRSSGYGCLLSLNILVSHLFACIYGSMQRPQRSAFVARMPFSAEVKSVGRPFKFQSLITTGSPRMSGSENTSEVGTLRARHYVVHISVSCFLQSPVKAPKQEMQAHDKKTLPTSFLIWCDIFSTSSFQRTPSSASWTTNLLARRILSSDCFMTRSVSAFSAIKSATCFSSLATLSLTSKTFCIF